MNFINYKPLVSVIVPFYNAEKTIARCIYSILESGKKIPLEIICVNDGSDDKGKRIVMKIICKHWNVKLVSHKKNRGLFQARITALKYVKGNYIGFVDSDDYVKSDYFEQLYKCAVEKQADIVFGRIVNVTKNNIHYCQTRCLDFPYGEKREDQDYYDMYWMQEGKCYPWHVMWNKLYRKEIWDASQNDIEKLNISITMMEDFVFSSIILSKTNKISASSSAYYYYVQNEEAVTAQTAVLSEWNRNIVHMGLAFFWISVYLCEVPARRKYIPHLKKWKERYSRYWVRNIEKADFSLGEIIELQELIKQTLQIETLEEVTEDDEFYYEEAEFGETIP